jgi:hypothetical protein
MVHCIALFIKREHKGFGGAVVRASTFHLWDGGFDSRYGLAQKDCLRSAKSRGFSPGAPVSSLRESWQGGLGDKHS